MKRFFIFYILLFVAVSSMNAQNRYYTGNGPTYFGYYTGKGQTTYAYSKGEEVWYKKDKQGRIYFGEGAEFMGPFPASCVKFSGYYVGEIVDPRDNYVNIRKGPGTNYPVVTRIYTSDWVRNTETYCDDFQHQGRFLYQKTNSNWYKIYSSPGKFLGYIYRDRIANYFCNEFY